MQVTIQSYLKKDYAIARIDLEIILSSVLKKNRSFLHSFEEAVVTEKQAKQIEGLIKRRENHEPLAYLLGNKEFYGRNFFVDKNVLIPRDETENLVEKVLEFSKNKKLTVVDVGTGSGCIAITLKLENPYLEVIAADISEQALKVAQKNAFTYQAEIKLLKSDLLEEVPKGIDIIAANLPYIPNKSWRQMSKEIRNFEPRLALDSGKSKKAVYQKLFLQAQNKLNKDGIIFYEVDGEVLSKQF